MAQDEAEVKRWWTLSGVSHDTPSELAYSTNELQRQIFHDAGFH